MAEGTKKTITLEKVESKPWNAPGTEKFYWTVTPKGFNSEPVKYVQDKSKGAPEPEVDKEFEGIVYKNDKGGFTIYPSLARKSSGWKGNSKDQKIITAQWALGKSIEIAIALNKVDDMDFIKMVGKDLYGAAEEIKQS